MKRTILNDPEMMQSCIEFYREEFPMMVDDTLTEIIIRLRCKLSDCEGIIFDIQDSLDDAECLLNEINANARYIEEVLRCSCFLYTSPEKSTDSLTTRLQRRSE